MSNSTQINTSVSSKANICAIFIKRPVASTLIMLGILIFGITGYVNLPVNRLPNVDFPTISVNAELSGASPETMAASVATPLEQEFFTIAGIDSISSYNTTGKTNISIQFSLDRDIDAAALDVQAAIGLAQRRLPSSMTTAPSFRKVNPADFPIIFLRISSDTLPLWQLNEYADTLIAQRLSMISGVAQVSIFGRKKYAVRVQLDPDALATRGLGIDEVVTSISSSNSMLPTGSLEGSERSSAIKTSGQLYNAKDFEDTVVIYQNGSPVRLKDIAYVVDSVQTNKQLNWGPGGLDTIMLAVERQPGANTVEVSDSVKEMLPILEKQLPPSVKIEIFNDQSNSIRESVEDVKFTLILTVGLVVLVIFIFLRNIPATIIPSLALPLSVIATFGVMAILNYSVDNLSLMALTLAVGFVVDDAIVMLENIVRHQEMGKPPLVAAYEGSAEINFTIVSMTLSLIAVFIPVVFMSGIIGRLFQEFAVVIIAAILCSCVVSLTLTPMLCAYFLKSYNTHEKGFYGLLEKFFNALSKYYEISLNKVLKWRFTTFCVSILILAATVFLAVIIPKGFLPVEDQGTIVASTEAQQGISFEGMVNAQKKLNHILENDPDIASFNSVVGIVGANRSMNNGTILLSLKPLEARAPIQQVAQRLREKLNNYPELRVFLRIPPPINVGGRSSRALYQYTLFGANMDALFDSAQKLEAELKKLPVLQDVNSDLQIRNPEIRLEIDRNKAAALGISPSQIEFALQSAFGSKEISTIYAPTNDYKVLVEVQKKFQDNKDSLAKLHIRAKDGTLVPLETLVTMKPSAGPITINHNGQFPAVTISFNLRPGISLSEAVEEVQNVAFPILDDSVNAEFQGTAQAFQKSLKGMGWLLLLAVVVIYLVLGILYESFIHPLTILSGLPAAGFGALFTLWLFGQELNLYGFIGIIMLLGIVKKNAIMMLDFALEIQRHDPEITPLEAITQGCHARFRPIMMTTMAALMGALPIAIGYGAGGEARQPLGLAVVGGLCFSQLITLYITPVYYYYIEKLSQGIKTYNKPAFNQ